MVESVGTAHASQPRAAFGADARSSRRAEAAWQAARTEPEAPAGAVGEAALRLIVRVVQLPEPDTRHDLDLLA